MANNRWRLVRKLKWGQEIDPWDGSYVGWHARHHKNDKRDRYRMKKRGINAGADFGAKVEKPIIAVHGGRVQKKTDTRV